MFLPIFVCKIAHIFDKEKKHHNISETLIKSCMLKAAGLVLEKTYSKKTVKISLSDSTIETPINELAKDMEYKFLKKLQASLFLLNSMW